LVDKVFVEAEKQRKAAKPRLEKEKRRLQRERQQEGEEISRLVSAIASAESPMSSVVDQLRETEQLISRFDQRLEEIGTKLNQLKSETINRDHLTETLSQFEPLWEVLNEVERTRLVNLVVESAVYDSVIGDVQISLSVKTSPIS
jgi:septal ring factor EnvC (AmiA/AmiB activator)